MQFNENFEMRKGESYVASQRTGFIIHEKIG